MKNVYTPGFAMIEILAAMTIIAIILLSLLSYQIAMLKKTSQLNAQSLVMMQLMNFSDVLSVNQNIAYRDRYLQRWNKNNIHLLHKGEGSFNVLSAHICQISIQWFEGNLQKNTVNVIC